MSNTNHHVITEASLVPVSQVVDVPEFLQKIVVVPPMEAAHVSPLAALSDKDVFEPAGAQGGSGSVIELCQSVKLVESNNWEEIVRSNLINN